MFKVKPRLMLNMTMMLLLVLVLALALDDGGTISLESSLFSPSLR